MLSGFIFHSLALKRQTGRTALGVLSDFIPSHSGGEGMKHSSVGELGSLTTNPKRLTEVFRPYFQE